MTSSEQKQQAEIERRMDDARRRGDISDLQRQIARMERFLRSVFGRAKEIEPMFR